MAHEIVFEGVCNDWNSALPLGNGKYGAMAFFRDGALHIALNHYDIYYRGLPGEMEMPTKPGETAEADHYIESLHPGDGKRPTYSTASYPVTGEIVIPLRTAPGDFTLRLIIEEGVVRFDAGGAGAVIWIAKHDDALFCDLRGDWGAPEFSGDDAILLDCAQGRLCAALAPGYPPRYDALWAEHQAAWKSFWRSGICLPDKFLEKLWYLHLYVIECACGRGSAYPEQACGLNGLWDIRRPVLWSSCWYWDVNIQQAFWPAFSANHLEIARLFCEGYLRYADRAIAFAREVHGIDGWALDYPHMYYNCIQPWCAQFLWRYFEYGGDRDFLEHTAYPVFQKQIAAFSQLARPDAQGTLHIQPDISPEQGPLGRDSVITIASVRMLLSFSIKAAALLGRPGDAAEYEALLAALPAYTLTADATRWKDSPDAPDDLFLRHPSVLMPIFPAEEISKHSPPGVLRIAKNTLRHAIENTEIGVFGFGWLAGAAARLDEGGAALRILYEKGIDYSMHPNGLGYEESERYVNYCLITKPPLFPPAMMEASGGLVMAINTMLLQADDAIEVFPAVPDGRDDLRTRKAQYRHQDERLCGTYPAWDDCAFDGLLAPGGFAVSAQMRAGKTVWISVTATFDARLKLRLPPGLGDAVLERDMRQGGTISFGTRQEDQAVTPAAPMVQVRQAAFTGRRVYLGGNRHSEFHRAVDSFTCAYLLGNHHQYPMTPYVFDFSETAKDYDDAYHRQFCLTGRTLLSFGAPRQVGACVYAENVGYGFVTDAGLTLRDRGAPDALRRDFIEGTTGSAFLIRLPKGKYSLLVISGDETDMSCTHLNGEQGSILRAGEYQCRIIPFFQENDGVYRLSISTKPGYAWKLNAVFLNKEYAL